MFGRDAAARAIRDETPFGYSEQRVMRVEIGGLGEEGLVGRDDRQIGIIGEPQEMGLPRRLAITAMALDLDIEPVAKAASLTSFIRLP